MTGKEKTLAAQPVQDVLRARGAVSDGECDVIGKRTSSSFHLDLVRPSFQRRRSCRCAFQQHGNFIGVNGTPCRRMLEKVGQRLGGR